MDLLSILQVSLSLFDGGGGGKGRGGGGAESPPSPSGLRRQEKPGLDEVNEVGALPLIKTWLFCVD